MAHEKGALEQTCSRVGKIVESLQQKEAANSSIKEVGDGSKSREGTTNILIISQEPEEEANDEINSTTKEAEDGSKSQVRSHDRKISKESGEKATNETDKHTKSHKGSRKEKNEEHSHPKRVVGTWVKKEKDGATPAVLNGSASFTKQSLTTGSNKGSDSETAKGDAKFQRLGSLPNYDFSFRCVERAEKRKEFYAKVKENIHAKEAEKAALEAKKKEAKEAEIKLLRKTLKFKANPMPSFYQEYAPKRELKKAPSTKPKSPKLGRQKSVPLTDGERTNCDKESGWSSMDEKASQKVSSPKKTKKRRTPKVFSQEML